MVCTTRKPGTLEELTNGTFVFLITWLFRVTRVVLLLGFGHLLFLLFGWLGLLNANA